jgi:hypothetical protein
MPGDLTKDPTKLSLMHKSINRFCLNRADENWTMVFVNRNHRVITEQVKVVPEPSRSWRDRLLSCDIYFLNDKQQSFFALPLAIDELLTIVNRCCDIKLQKYKLTVLMRFYAPTEDDSIDWLKFKKACFHEAVSVARRQQLFGINYYTRYQNRWTSPRGEAGRFLNIDDA